MKITIVLTTYNGEKYLLDQLKSILNQTIKPDEVLISDDVSTDDTIKILKEFIRENKLDNWKLQINKKNIGWQTNFFNTIMKATGDIIFLADQDDIWNDSKIEEMTNQLLKNEEILLLASEYTIIDENNNLISSKKNISNTYDLEKIAFDRSFYLTKYPGCVLAFRKSMLPYIEKIFFNSYPHDQLLFNLALILNGAYVYPKPLIKHRKHPESAMSKEKLITIRKKQIENGYLVSKKISGFIKEIDLNLDERTINIIEEYVEFSAARKNMLTHFTVFNIYKLLTHYKFYYRKRTMLGDFNFFLSNKKLGI